MTQLSTQTIHVRFNGRSEELSASSLPMTSYANDTELKRAIACQLDLPQSALDQHVVTRTSQAIIIRPEAIYG